MGNTPSTFDDGTPIPTKEEMRIAEDACAECEHKCDVLEYPTHITMRIHRDYVLHNSGKLHRWHVVIHSGVPASKWPRDIGKEPGYVQDVENATKKLQKDGLKFGVSLIPLGPESGCNPQEATDITIFPEFVRYHDVPRDQIENVLKYHTKIIAPRHQEWKRYEKTLEEYQIALNSHPESPQTEPTPPAQPQLTPEQQTELDTILKTVSDEKRGIKSKFVLDYDRVEHRIGTTDGIPIPTDLSQHTIILLCGHTIRDKRCGVTAPILRTQIENVMEEKHKDEINNIYLDLVSHVGGHKVAGNMLIFSRKMGFIFYGRVFPQHVENIIDKTIFGGEILDPLARARHDDLW